MFGKRGGAIPIEGIDHSKSQKFPHTKNNNPIKIINTEADGRPFLEVSVYGVKFIGLLDSGASVTVIRDCETLRRNHKSLTRTDITLRVANKGYLAVLGQVRIPFRCQGRTIELQTIVVEELEQNLLLGYDFWQAAGLKIIDSSKELLSVAPDLDREIKTETELDDKDMKALKEAVSHFLVMSKGIIGRTHLIEHKIELVEDAKPFTRKTHFYSPTLMSAIYKELDKMLEQGVIKPSQSPVASPVVPIKKPDGSVRLCLDSRQLNAITKRDQYPIPNPNHIFSRLERAPYRTVIDLSKAFWQTPLSEEKIKGQFANSQELTAFVIPMRGLFQFTRMPFGLTNAPATQCRLMDRVLKHDLEPYCTVYMDDILLTAQTIEQMIKLIRKVAIRLRAANLSINLDKSKFLAASVKYLGYILNDQGIAADPDRIAVMVNYPIPKNTKGVRRFLGLTGYYRRLIRNYSGIASPLTNLLKKESKFYWSEGADEAFNRLKQAMVEAPVIASPDFNQDFNIQCDASDVAGAAALGQKHGEEEVIVAYFSHKWTQTEAKWGSTEREAATVLFALRHFRDYIWGRPILVITDAQALIHVRTLKTEGSSRLARWALELNEFDLTVKHRAGKLSSVPDALSRAVETIEVINVEQDQWGSEMIAKIQQNPDLYPDFKVEGTRLMKYESTKDDIGCYSYRWKEYVPTNNRDSVIKGIHEQLAHLGWEKCTPAIRKRFFWPKIVATIEKVVRSCDICKSAKSAIRNTKVPMGSSRKPDYPFQIIAIDHWGPAPRSRQGNAYLLVVVDVFSKFVLLNPSRDTGSETVVKFLEEQVFLRYGTPQILISDNHQPLVGRNMIQLLNKYHVQHQTIAAYHAQANPAERYVKTVSTAIRAKLAQNELDHRRWDEELPKIERALNSTESFATKKSPFVVNFGRDIVLTGDEYESIRNNTNRNEMSTWQLQESFQTLRNQLKANMEEASEKDRKQYDKGTRQVTFALNERVWRRNRDLSSAVQHFSQKLAPKYVPCRVQERVGRDIYVVRDEARESVYRVHANDLIKDYQG